MTNQHMKSVRRSVLASVSGMAMLCAGAAAAVELDLMMSDVDGKAEILREMAERYAAETGAINQIVHDIVVSLGGSISAEHGIGRLRRDENARYKSTVEMDLMRAVKQAIDPRGIMNPGKVVPD